MKNLFLLLFLSGFMVLACSNDKDNNITEDPIETPFAQKNLVVFGNSITAAKSSWAYQVYRQLNFGSIYNGALGGAIWSLRERTTASGKVIRTQNYDDPNFAGISNGYSPNPDDVEFQKRINNCAIVHIQKYLKEKTEASPDYIIISYGTNDLSGTIGDAETTMQSELKDVDMYTIAGAVRWNVETLRNEFPKVKIYIAFPLQAESASKNEGNLKKIAVIKDICNRMSVPYFDCYNESGITEQNQKDYLRDGLHPNEAGNRIHGNYIAEELKKREATDKR